MKAKQFILASLAAFLISNILTTIWYMIMDEPNYVPFRREEMDYGLMILNHLFYAALMVYFYPYFHAKKPTSGNAFFFGVMTAALMFIPQALVVRAIWTVEVNPMFFANTAAHLFIGGLMAIVIRIISKNQLSTQ